MQFQKFSRFFVAPLTCIAFFLSPFTSISVFANGSSNESDFWHGLYVEHVTKEISGTGVDIGNAESTDYGLTTGNYIYNKSGVTTQDVIDYVSGQYNNATGYVSESVSDYADKVKSVLNRTIDATLSTGYKAEKALRTVVDSAGNVYYNVSSSNYWNGIYNKWFNNNGYKDIYVNGNSNTVNGYVNGHSVSISFAGYVIDGQQIAVSENISNTIRQVVNMSAISTLLFDSSTPIVNNSALNRYDYIVFNITVDGVSCLIANSRFYSQTEYLSGEFQDSLYVYLYNETIYVGYTREQTKYIVFYDTVENVTTGGNPVLQPKQVGFIIYNGEHIPIYNDKTLNPSDWTINDNGTVTIDGDGDYPAYIDEKELTDDAWLDLLDLVSQDDERESTDKDPWGNPWDTQDDGSTLGGFFGNLVKDIQKMFKGIGDKIKEIFQKPIDVLSDLVEKIKKALKEFFTFSPNDLNVNVSFDFDILESIWNAFLGQFGLA